VGANSQSGAASGQKSAGTAVKEQGTQVAQSASQTGSRVAHSAAEQSKHVAQETGRQAHEVMNQAQAQLTEQVSAQQKRAAGGLRSLGDQLRSAVDKAEQPGPASDLVRQASERIGRVADWLEQREPGQVVEEVREFARRRPGAFLSTAAVAGLLLGRLTRSITPGGGGGGGEPQPGTGGPQPGAQAPQSGPVLAGTPTPILADTPSPHREAAR
jgi:ElaB/YqjD/DUF883 family membrane-anchored ribosome-binding protein